MLDEVLEAGLQHLRDTPCWHHSMEIEQRITCDTCIEDPPDATPGECPHSHRECGHHCNHIWTHDACCWCDLELDLEEVFE